MKQSTKKGTFVLLSSQTFKRTKDQKIANCVSTLSTEKTTHTDHTLMQWGKLVARNRKPGNISPAVFLVQLFQQTSNMYQVHF